ncbi:pre-mRNA-splicing factor cwc22 [Cryptotrichosporon argae]
MSQSLSPSASPPRRRGSSRSASPEDVAAYKRKRSLSPAPRDRSASPPSRRRRSRSPPHGPNGDAAGAGTLVKAADPDAAARAEFQKLLGSRSGGAYIPPARLRAMQAAASKDKSSPEYQRLSWDALKKSINGLINKVNVSNIKHVVPELFGENLVRGRGLFARAIMRAQASSLPFTPVFAALVAIVNTKLPSVGELLVHRLISQFRRAYKRNDKTVCHATSTFIAHLVNQFVAHEIVALQILRLCLERPTDDSIEVAVGFMREVGLFLNENSPKANNTVYERFRAVLHEGAISKRCQYMIEVLFQVRKDKYKDNPSIPEGLDLVEEEEQITHTVSLDDDLQVQEGLNLFKVDNDFEANQERYAEMKRDILGDSDDESGETASGSDESDDEDEDDVAPEKAGITDMTETNLINLRRTIYLTIMNSLNFEEAVHKLMKINIPEGREIELCNMIIECCSQERTYGNFYGLIGERFCKLNRVWTDCFQEAFQKYYDTIHRYETNKLRNIGRFFGHLLATDAISWAVLHVVHMNEDETTSSSRIFVKVVMTEMIENMGVKRMAERFKVPDLKPAFANIFPTDNPRNTRFAINYFTSIGLGAITEDMRAWLQQAPAILAAQHAARRAAHADSSDSDSDSSSVLSDSSDLSDSDSDDSRSPPPRRRRYSSEDSRDARRRRRSPSPVKAKRDDRDRSPRKKRDDSPPHRRVDSPPRRRDDSPPRRRDDRSPPRRRDDSPPPRRRYSDDRSPGSPPPPRRDAKRYDDNTPPRRGGPDNDRSPPRRRHDDSPPRRRDERSPPRRRYDDRR